MSDNDAPMVELGRFVNALRAQLAALDADRPEEGVVFETGPVEISLDLATEIDGTMKGGLKFLVFSAEAEAGARRTRTQRMTLTLHPRLAGRDGPLLVEGREDARPR